MRKLRLSGKNSDAFALVSDEDYERLVRVKWYLHRDGYVSNGHEALHRAVFGGEAKGWHVDHINRNKLDNRRENLRLCTNAQNSRNKVHPTTHTYRGVTRAGGGRYRATLRQKSLGTFPTKEDAARAYNEEALRQYGEFALLNEVPS